MKISKKNKNIHNTSTFRKGHNLLSTIKKEFLKQKTAREKYTTDPRKMEQSTMMNFASMSLNGENKRDGRNKNNNGGKRNQNKKRRDGRNKNNNNNNKNVPKESLYKTELCRQYAISGQCSYGPRCQVRFYFSLSLLQIFTLQSINTVRTRRERSSKTRDSSSEIQDRKMQDVLESRILPLRKPMHVHS